jgi:hypothetical protein
MAPLFPLEIGLSPEQIAVERRGSSACIPRAVPHRQAKVPDLLFVKPRFATRESPCRSGKSSLNTGRSSSPCRSMRLISTRPKTSRHPFRDTEEEIRARMRAEIELTASAGVSYNKFLAKLGCDHRKPDGLCDHPENGAVLVETLPVRKFHGIGRRPPERWRGSVLRPGSILRARRRVSCSIISGGRLKTLFPFEIARKMLFNVCIQMTITAVLINNVMIRGRAMFRV